jgi:RNA polymerase sigma-70 factor (ECF subfamily)
VRFDPDNPAHVALVVRAALGDRSALDLLLRSIQQPLFDHIAFVVQDPDAAADVLQDVLLSVSRSLIQLHDPSLLRAWSFRIATRAAVRHLRRSRRVDAVALDQAPDMPMTEAEGPPFDPDLIAALRSQIAELPAASQIVVRLRYLEDLSLAEVAEVLDVPVGTVKSRAAYGIAWLRQRLIEASAAHY